KALNDRLHTGCRLCASRNRRNIANTHLGLVDTQALVREEEESLVFYDWAAENSAKVVLVIAGLCLGGIVGKPVVRVQGIIPEVIKDAAVKVVGPRASDEHDLTATP